MLGFFIVFFGSYLAANIYIFIRGLRAISGLPLYAKVAFGIVFWLLFFLFFFFFRNRQWSIPEQQVHSLYQLGSAWLIFTLYMTLLLLAFDLLKYLGLQWNYSMYASLGITACLLLYGNYKYHHPLIERIDLAIHKPINQPDKQLKIAAISDIHLGHGTGKKQLQNFIKQINAQEPDLILIGGDLIDNSTTPLYKANMEEELSELKAPQGIYMVLGNHEYFGEGIEQVKEFLSRTPIVLLRDSLIELPNGLQLVGRDDRHNPNRRQLASWKSEIDPGKPSILLEHQPYDLTATQEAGIDLQFSGHTHRGQVWPFNWLTDRLFELSHGYLQKGDSHFIVSSGLSLWGPPFRIGTQSEIVILNLHFK